MHPSGLKISSPRRPQKDIIDKICPNSSDIEVAREFLISIGALHESTISSHSSRGIENVVNWMQVNYCILCIKRLTLKARQTNPHSPPELIRQYQVASNFLFHYSRSSSFRPAVPDDSYFFRNVHKASGFSIIDSWMNLKKLLNRRKI